MEYDAQSNRVILFGGCTEPACDNGETWAFDVVTNAWTELAPALAPSPRHGASTAYDAGSDRIILFGGFHTSHDGETWAYDFGSNTWANMRPLSAPSPRYNAAMAYDAQSDRVILSGGSTASGLSDETWAYDLDSNSWTNMSPPSRPSARSWHAMVYDSGSDRAIVFGGFTGISFANGETWAYDFESNTWTDLRPTTNPPPRSAHAMAYMSQTHRVLLFGGNTGRQDDDTWSYIPEENRWTNLNPATRPAGRLGHRMAYDSQSNRVILFGGKAQDVISDETWAYEPLPVPDTIPPTISITSPTSGAVLVARNVTVSGTASDNVEVERIEVSLDGTTWVLATGTVSWHLALRLAEGSNTISARAVDAAGNTGIDVLSITVSTTTVQGGGLSEGILGVAILVGVAMVAAIAGLALRKRRRS